MKNKRRSRNNKKQQQNRANLNQIINEQKSVTDAIVRAHQIIEEQKIEKEMELEKLAKQEWQEILGQKEYPEKEKWYMKKIHEVRNNLVAMWKLLFFKEKNARDLRATFSLIQLAVIEIFKLCKWCLYAVTIVIIFSMFTNGIDILLDLMFAFVTWVFARLFRIASFEVEKVKDRNLLIALFSGCVSFVAMVVAIIALFTE